MPFPLRHAPFPRRRRRGELPEAGKEGEMVKGSKKKSNVEGMNSRLALVMKSGKYTLGYKTTLKSLRSGKAKLVVIANNCPPLRKSEIEYYAMLAQCGVHHYNGSTLGFRFRSPLPAHSCPHIHPGSSADNVDLGTACGRLYTVGSLCITDPGDSDILKTQACSHVLLYCDLR